MMKAEPIKIRKSPAKKTFTYNIRRYGQFYFLLLPGLLYYLVFKYLPMYGVIIAFKDYYPWTGVINSEWVGLKHFMLFITGENFLQLLRNTLILSGLKILFGFPAPIILALLLNEAKGKIFKRTIQTISYLPHFLSWVIIYGIVYNLFNTSYGVVNEILKNFGKESIALLSEPKYFRRLIVLTGIWQSVGWGSIIYIAALSGIDTSLYEAARIDGANKMQQLLFVTLPGLLPTIAIMFLLGIGQILNQDFQQFIVFQGGNPLMLEVGDVFETYVYRMGLLQGNYSFGTAVGLFQSVFGMFLVILANKSARKFGYRSIW